MSIPSSEIFHNSKHYQYLLLTVYQALTFVSSSHQPCEVWYIVSFTDEETDSEQKIFPPQMVG